MLSILSLNIGKTSKGLAHSKPNTFSNCGKEGVDGYIHRNEPSKQIVYGEQRFPLNKPDKNDISLSMATNLQQQHRNPAASCRLSLRYRYIAKIYPQQIKNKMETNMPHDNARPK